MQPLFMYTLTAPLSFRADAICPESLAATITNTATAACIVITLSFPVVSLESRYRQRLNADDGICTVGGHSAAPAKRRGESPTELSAAEKSAALVVYEGEAFDISRT